MTRPEAILEARRKRDAGEFQRLVVKRTPVELHWDSVELECGHSGRDVSTQKKDAKIECLECSARWLKENSDE